MAQSKDHLSDLDRHVHLLESKVNQLRSSLTHWQQWYLEYSALKEEVEQLPTDPPPHEQLRRIRRDFDGKLLSKKEVNEILGKNDLKQPEQIVSVLSRRMDYVEKNIDSLTKLIKNEENKLAAASVVANPDAGTDEETGLPLTDIIEELDDDDNVINFRLQSGSDVEPKIIEALKKAGIQEKDIPETEGELAKHEEAPSSTPKQDEAAKQPVADPAAITGDSKASPPSDGPATRKKSVSFAEDTKPGDAAAEPPKSRAAEKLQRLMQQAREQEAMDMSTAVIPDNESPEDSELRREMLKYGMSEIGPVVAELTLEEGYSDDEYDMDWDGIDDELEEEETDDDGEDELGRSKRSVISSDYIKRMQELEKRLNVQSAFTVGGSETKPKPQDEGIGRIAVVGDSSSSAAAPTPASRGKKSVSFASKLDIAPNPEPQPPSDVRPKERKIADVGDVVEKTAEPELVKEPEEPPKRVSRFKKERATVASSSISPAAALPPGPHQLPATLFPAKTIPPVEPAPPEHGTLAPTVVERATAPDPAEPDEMDDALLYQAAAVEYSRLRNQLIQKQGGFLQQDGAIDSETGLVPLDEELGGPKRMSKFKAARLTKLQ
jgi:unconventional prefoldin RPB5 interactor 1